MKRLGTRTFILFCFLLCFKAFGLGIDEKLTMRIIKVSNSKKTLLINRGLEDGLVVGDHAKFFLTTGVVARGVLVKSSPSRSIWSMYRVVSGEKLRQEMVLNLKISSPLKITDDESKMITKDKIPVGVPVMSDETDMDKNDLNRLRMAGGDDEDAGENRQRPMMGMVPNKKYYRNMDTRDDSKADGRGVADSKSIEVFSTFNFSYFTEEYDTGVEGENPSQSDSSEIALSVGLEKYFPEPMARLRNLSFIGQFDYSSKDTTENNATDSSATTTTTSSEQLMGISGGMNWHFLNDPFSFEKLIVFGGGTLGLGQISKTTESDEEAGTDETTYSDFSMGVGIKYYTEMGFGLRTLVDFYSRTESTEKAVLGTTEIKKKSGPRIKVGLSFRF